MISLYNANCLDTLKGMEDNSIDLVVTSPPYDNLRKYNDSSTWDFEIFKRVAELLSKKLVEGGVIVWVVADKTEKGSETLTSFKQALYFKELGLNIWDTMIWRKPNPSVPTESRYYNAFEYMFVISKGKPKAMNFICDKENKTYGNSYSSDSKMNPEVRRRGGKVKTVGKFSRRHNVWDIPIGGNKTGHPAVFPLSLAQDHIKTWSNEGDTVLDPFMGSGTVGVACKELNREFIGIEIDENYFKNAVKRLDNE